MYSNLASVAYMTCMHSFSAQVGFQRKFCQNARLRDVVKKSTTVCVIKTRKRIMNSRRLEKRETCRYTVNTPI